MHVCVGWAGATKDYSRNSQQQNRDQRDDDVHRAALRERRVRRRRGLAQDEVVVEQRERLQERRASQETFAASCRTFGCRRDHMLESLGEQAGLARRAAELEAEPLLGELY